MPLACVTGASGFVGQGLLPRLAALGVRVRPARRGPASAGEIGELAKRSQGELARALEGADAVYHLAALIGGGTRPAAPADYAAINCDLSLRLFRAARAAGVGVFLWLGTIKVLGEVAEAPLRPDAPYAPADEYAASKMRAERALLESDPGAMRLIVVRPPLVYGPGVKGNFASLLRLCRTGLPLPLAGAEARRAMVGRDNLADFLAHAAAAPLDSGAILHVRDAEEWKVTDLVAELQRLAGHPRRQFRVPRSLLAPLARRLGRQGALSRLFDPLRVDAQGSQRRLGWQPLRRSQDMLEETVAWRAPA